MSYLKKGKSKKNDAERRYNGLIVCAARAGPGPSSYSVVRWTAPSHGTWDVVGQFFGTGLTTGDVHVLRDGISVFDSQLNGSATAAFSLAIKVVPGDTIDFAAGQGADGNGILAHIEAGPKDEGTALRTSCSNTAFLPAGDGRLDYLRLKDATQLLAEDTIWRKSLY